MTLGSFRLRLSLWNATVLLLLAGCFGTALCWTSQQQMQDGMDQQLRVRAERSTMGPPHGPPRPPPSGPPPSGPPGMGPNGMGPNGPGGFPPDHGAFEHGGPDHDGPGFGGPGFDGPRFGGPRGGGPRGDGPGFGGPGGGDRADGGSDHGFRGQALPEQDLPALVRSGEVNFKIWPPMPEVVQFASLQIPRFIRRDGRVLRPPLSPGPWDLDPIRAAVSGKETFTTVEIDGEPLRVLTVPWRAGGVIVGAVQVADDLGNDEKLWARQWKALLTLLPISALAAVLGGLFLTGRALRPVREVTHAAEQIGAEDLSRRLEVHGRDELAELATTFNGMIARLDEAFQRQRQFTADASHELRTPLTRIKVSTSEALNGAHSPEEYRAALQAADRSADAMGRLLEQLLTLARVDEGRLRPHDLLVDLSAVIEEAAEHTSASGRAGDGRAGSGSAPVRLDLPEDPVFTTGDGAQLERVFVNLLENARRHTPSDGQITVALRRLDDRVVASVADTGEGIPPESLPHLGERFYRVDASRTRSGGGSGLGLAICRAIVHAHGGDMRFESEPGQGTIVIVSLPRAEADYNRT